MRRYGIRTLLCVMALVAVFLSVWQRQRSIMNRIAEEHYQVMENGFRAIECQRPINDPSWMGIFNKTNYSSANHYRDWLAGIQMDRNSLLASRTLWNTAIQHAAIRDHYRSLARTPWMIWTAPPPPRDLPPLPDDDTELKAWWYRHIEPFVDAEAFNNSFFTTSNREETLAFNCEIMNHVGATGGKDAVRKWFALRELVGPKQP